MQCPLSHDVAHILDRLVAHRRAEVDKEFALTVLRPPGHEGIAEKAELLLGVASLPVVILTVDNLRLLGMERQFTQGEPAFKGVFQPSGLVSQLYSGK